MSKSTCFSVTTLAFLLVAGGASAQEPPPWFEPAPPDTPLPPNITPNPDGTVSVTRTPEAGVDVHATTSAGTVHGYGCSRVDVDPNARSNAPHGPCPLAHLPPAPPPPPVYMPPPPPRFMYPPLKNPTQAMKPRWAPDPARRNALIASSIVFGLGTMLSGTAYTVSAMTSSMCNEWSGVMCSGPSKPALYAMGTFLTITPSIPRFVVGDYGKAILYTALRGGSFAAGAFVDWNDPTYLVPITLSFIAPLTLGIIDLATTPHREQLEAPAARTAASDFQLLGLGPTVAMDFRGQSIPAFGAIGTF
ncbi:MAG: hypothetical protein IPM54_02955 [Polyangiaceae bacterium]|nr:hypothetical protein [Polyangiaceae bacterium]